MNDLHLHYSRTRGYWVCKVKYCTGNHYHPSLLGPVFCFGFRCRIGKILDDPKVRDRLYDKIPITMLSSEVGRELGRSLGGDGNIARFALALIGAAIESRVNSYQLEQPPQRGPRQLPLAQFSSCSNCRISWDRCSVRVALGGEWCCSKCTHTRLIE